MDTRTERAPSLCPMIALTYSAMLASRGLATLFDTLLHALRLRCRAGLSPSRLLLLPAFNTTPDYEGGQHEQ